MEAHYEVSFQSYKNTTLHGIFVQPRTVRNAPVIITFHDYGFPLIEEKDHKLSGFARLYMELRGHNTLQETIRPHQAHRTPLTSPPRSGYNPDAPEDSYMYAVYLDSIRVLDFLRLQKGVDITRMGILGEGLGASLAVFAANHRNAYILGLALERPAFGWIHHWLEESSSPLAMEIRTQLQELAPRHRTKIKKNLEYFDPINFIEGIRAKSIVSVNMEDALSPPRSVFGLFNHMKSEKIMDLYMDLSQDPGGMKRRHKSYEHLIEVLKPV